MFVFRLFGRLKYLGITVCRLLHMVLKSIGLMRVGVIILFLGVYADANCINVRFLFLTLLYGWFSLFSMSDNVRRTIHAELSVLDARSLW